MDTTYTDRTVLQRNMCALRDGDRDAFDAVYTEVWPLVVRFAQKLLSDQSDADDAAQQALLKVFSNTMAFDPTRQAMPWILGITYNECRTIRKQRQRAAARFSSEIPEEISSTSDDPERAHMTSELQAALSEAMGELRQEDIDTLWAAVGKQPRPDIPAATFRKRFQRALARLKTVWKQRHEQL